MKIRRLFGAIVASVTLANISYAAMPGFYLGGGLGVGNLSSFSDVDTKKTSGFAGSAFIGYNFTKYIGIEANYKMFSKGEYTLPGYRFLNVNYNLKTFSVDGKFYLPFEKTPLSLYFLLGVAEIYGECNVDYKGENILSDANNAVVGTFGLGIGYDINTHFTLNLEDSFTGGSSGDKHNLGIPRSNLLSLNIAYSFG